MDMRFFLRLLSCLYVNQYGNHRHVNRICLVSSVSVGWLFSSRCLPGSVLSVNRPQIWIEFGIRGFLVYVWCLFVVWVVRNPTSYCVTTINPFIQLMSVYRVMPVLHETPTQLLEKWVWKYQCSRENKRKPDSHMKISNTLHYCVGGICWRTFQHFSEACKTLQLPSMENPSLFVVMQNIFRFVIWQ